MKLILETQFKNGKLLIKAHQPGGPALLRPEEVLFFEIVRKLMPAIVREMAKVTGGEAKIVAQDESVIKFISGQG